MTLTFRSISNRVERRFREYGVTGLARWMGSVAWYFLLRYGLRREFWIREVHGYRLKLSLHDPGISRELLVNGSREPQVKHILERHVEPDMTVLDLGANVGYYTAMLAHLVGPKGHVYAAEPAPTNFQRLRENIRLNAIEDIVTPLNIGFSNHVGTERFYLSTYSNLGTFIPVNRDGTYKQKGLQDRTLDVEVTDLSSFLHGREPIDLIRMDVEGYEVEIIEGLETALTRGEFSGALVFECHFPKYDATHSIRDSLEMLFRHGYDVSLVTSTEERRTQIRKFGYKPEHIVVSGGRRQGVYSDISNDDALRLIADIGGVRDALLLKRQ